jgi:hypothetical protein
MLLWLALTCGIVLCIVQIVKESRISAAENALQAQARLTQEKNDIDAAVAWMKVTPVCPVCKTNDGRRRDSEGRVILVDDGPMSLAYSYCDGIWHSAHFSGCGTYGGVTQRAALVCIGQRLRK